MRIVVNALSARLGGGQTYLRNLLSHLPVDEGLRVYVFSPDNLSLPKHPCIERVSISWPTTNPILRTLWEFFRLPAFLRSVQADVLFCPGGVVATKPPDGCMVVTTFQNMIPFTDSLVRKMPWGYQRIRNIILRRTLLRSLSESDLTIFISDYARQVIEAIKPVRHSVTVPHGISDAFRFSASAQPRPAACPAGDYILYVSRFDSYKHHQEVVQAFAALPPRLRDQATMVFVGETNLPEARTVGKLLTELHLSDKVLIAGEVPHENLPAWYQNARLIIFASSCENCPNILLESLCANRPVICSDVMPMPEFGGTDLIYFSPFDPTSLNSALITTLESPHECERIAAAALRQSRKYTWEDSAGKTWQSIFRTIEANRAQRGLP